MKKQVCTVNINFALNFVSLLSMFNTGKSILFTLFLLCFFCACDTSQEITSSVIIPPPDSIDLPCPCLYSKKADANFKNSGIVAKTDRLDSIFTQKHKKNSFNGCVLVVQKGTVLYKKCFGSDCFGKEENDLTFQHKFQLASVTKTFTAVAILKLYEEGKLSLDDTLQKFIPEFPYENITVKLLLNHRSGLPYYAYAFHDKVKYGQTGPDKKEVIQWFIKEKPAVYRLPDTGFGYCNTNYILLAEIIEKVSGKSYESYLREEIFKPLCMNDTYVITDKNFPNTLMTCGHQRKKQVEPDYFDLVVGDKGIYSTLDDMHRWYLALTSGCILKKETMALMTKPYSLEHPGTRHYGLGFRMRIELGEENPHYVYHNGWWRGYNNMFWMIPEEEALIIVLGNTRNRNVYKIKEVLEVIEGVKESDEEDAED